MTHTPLVSVIVRTMGRPELQQALTSIGQQEWPAVEVVLVDAAGRGELPQLTSCGPFPLRIVGTGAPLPRPQAANVGLEAAQGELLMFLDEDDFIAPEHLAGLARALMASSAVAAYSGVQAVRSDGSVAPDAACFNFGFDRLRLMWGNFIPIHAVLFRRSVVEAGCRFDAELPIYEDWDFWLQVVALGELLHLPQVSAFYRAGGSSGVGGVSFDPVAVAAGRARIFGKWARIWSGAELLGLMDSINQQAELDRLHQELEVRGEHICQREARIESINSHVQTLQNELATVHNHLDGQTAILAHKDEQLVARQQELTALQGQMAAAEQRLVESRSAYEAVIAKIMASTSWRLTAPLRWLMTRGRASGPQAAGASSPALGRDVGEVLLFGLEQFTLREAPFGANQVLFYSGWAVTREGGVLPRLELRADGTAVERIQGSRKRPDVFHQFSTELPPGGEAEIGFQGFAYIERGIQQVALVAPEYGVELAVATHQPQHAPSSSLGGARGRWSGLLQRGLRLAATARRKVGWRDLISPQRWRYLYGKGRQEYARLLREALPEEEVVFGQPLEPYAAWRYHNQITPALRAVLEQAAAHFDYRPTFSIVMPVYNGPARYLQIAVDSLRAQIWPHWQLCLADDGSTREETLALLTALEAEQDPRISILRRQQNGHICQASNSAVELAWGEFLVLMDQDDELAPHALFELARALNGRRELDLIYSDEDKVDEAGQHYDPHFKPDFSPVLLLGYNYINHVTCVRRSLFEQVGRFREGFEGAQDYDLLLRISEQTDRIHHIPKVLYHWRSLPESTASAASAKPIVRDSAIRALREHLTRRGITATPYQPQFAVRHHLPIEQLDGLTEGPSVAILIPARNQAPVTRRCVESIRSKTRYRNYQLVLIDNDSDEREALVWYQAEAAAGTQVLQIASPGGRFSFSYLNNRAAEQVTADYLLLLNNDTEVVDGEWLGRLLRYLLLPGIGAVGARLCYPSGELQHAGVVLGLGKDGAPGHAFYRQSGQAISPFFQAEVAREVSAVTGACLLTSRELYLSLGGFDESDFPVSLNDVDYCLRLRKQGLRTLYVGDAELIHYESLSRAREDDPAELARFHRRHGGVEEPWYNINLAKDGSYLPAVRCGLDYLPYLGRPPRVVFYSHNLNHEGAPKVVLSVATTLHAMGVIQAHVVAPMAGPAQAELQRLGVGCTVLPPRGTDNLLKGWAHEADYRQTLAELRQWLAAERPDVVVANVLNSYFAVNVAHELGIPALFIIHESYDRGQMVRHLPPFAIDECEQAFVRAGRVVFVSDQTRQMYRRYDVLGNATVIYNGLAPEFSARIDPNTRAAARAALAIQAERPVLLTIGTICERKDQETLVRAVAQIAQRRKDILALIVGARRQDPYVRFLEGLIERLGVAEQVRLVEETAEVERYYASADLFVFTSLNESYSLTVLEAMAWGLPIVTTPVCGVREQVRFKVNAEEVPFRDPQLLAQTINGLLAQPERQAALGAASRAMMDYMPDHQAMIGHYQALLAEVWAQGAATCDFSQGGIIENGTLTE